MAFNPNVDDSEGRRTGTVVARPARRLGLSLLLVLAGLMACVTLDASFTGGGLTNVLITDAVSGVRSVVR